MEAVRLCAVYRFPASPPNGESGQGHAALQRLGRNTVTLGHVHTVQYNVLSP